MHIMGNTAITTCAFSLHRKEEVSLHRSSGLLLGGKSHLAEIKCTAMKARAEQIIAE